MGNLEYIDNIDYEQNYTRQPTIEDFLIELKECIATDLEIATLYKIIRKEVEKEIKMQDLAITQIMPDLIEVRKENTLYADILETLLANPYITYQGIGALFGISKQLVDYDLKKMASRYNWLRAYLNLKNADHNRNRKGADHAPWGQVLPDGGQASR